MVTITTIGITIALPFPIILQGCYQELNFVLETAAKENCHCLHLE